MTTILLCSGTLGALDELHAVLSAVESYDVRPFERGLDAAIPIVTAEPPSLLIVDLSDFHSASYVKLLQLQTNLPELPVLVFGNAMEYVNFLAGYMGSKLPQIMRPIEEERLYDTVKRALKKAAKKKKEKEKKKPHILMVDDNAATLRSTKAMLEPAYEVTIVTSGADAMKFFEKTVPDLVLLDYEMPEMDGREVLEKIRADKRLSKLKVLFLTGINDREHIAAAMALHPAGYLLKPIEKERLDAAVAATLVGKSPNRM